MKYENLRRYAVRILDAYNGAVPLHSWIKDFFRANPQMGSRDRKQVSEMVYCYFRLGQTLKGVSPEDRIVAGLFLANSSPEPILEHLKPDWHRQIEIPLAAKLDILQEKYPDFDVLDIFPWKSLLSKGVDHRSFCISFLQKPRLFVRVRPGREMAVNTKLSAAALDFRDADAQAQLPFRTYSFAGGTRLGDVFQMNREVVVQDLSSQRTALYMNAGGRTFLEAWDCCAGSGGKSILLSDLYPQCELTVSDIRESILKNLRVRFDEAGLHPKHLFTTDLTEHNERQGPFFPVIVADLPCTGSGTWARTPEAIRFFSPGSVTDYRQRQEKILNHITGSLKPGGILIYITCSVFADENENVASHAASCGKLEIEKQAMITGYADGADSMYVCRFIRK